MDEIAFGLGDRPRLADGRAALGNDRLQFHLPAHRHRHAAFLEHVAVQIDLRGALGEIAAGQAADDGLGA